MTHTPESSRASSPRNGMSNTNRMKLGTFGTNARGTAHTRAPDTHKPTRPNTLHAARLADALGFEAILGLARWKGVVDNTPDHPSGVVLDPFTWAAGLAQATSYSTIFATAHAPMIHPLVVAKQTATIDIISGGRLGLNVVGGWNRPEFEMFGSALADHNDRYEHLEEWLHVLDRLWSETAEFDHQGRFLNLKGAVSRPQPLQQPRPVIMNAGTSGRGQRFACEHADACFVSLAGDDPAAWKKQVDGYKNMARDEFGRDVSVWTLAAVVQRATRQEAEEYLHYYAVEYADRVAVDGWHARFLKEAQPRYTEEQYQKAYARSAAAGGGQLLTGTRDDIADWLERFADVMPLLESRGLREPFHPIGKTTAGVKAY